MRDNDIQSIRINLNLPKDQAENVLINFQNEVLRPILKFQHEIIQMVFERHSEKRKTNLSSIDEKKIEAFIEKQIGSDLQLKAQMVGFICGLFSSAELKVYLAHEKELKKRIVSMLIQRLKSIYQVKKDYT